MNRKALESFFLYKFILFGVAWLAMFFLLRRAPESLSEFLENFSQWDSNWFLQTAKFGYLVETPSIQNFPLYPFSFRLLDYVIGNLKLSALIVSQLGSFFSFYYFYKVAELQLGKAKAKVALILFAFFPTAYFMTASYSESITIALVMACIYYARTGKYKTAGLLAILATLGRTQSMALIPGVVALFILDPSSRTKEKIKGWAWVAVGALIGYVIYLLINKSVHGEYFYYLKFIKTQFKAHSTWPFNILYQTLFVGLQGPYPQLTRVTMPAVFTIMLIFAMIPIWKSKNRFDFGFSLGILFLLSSINLWISHPRYCLMVYPLFISTASFFDKSKWLLWLYIMISGGLMVYFWILHLRGIWAF